MADTTTQDPPQDTTPVGALVGGSSDDSIGGLVSDKSVVKGLTDVQRRRTAADEAVIDRGDRQNEADRAVIQRAFNAEGHGPDELKPWDANKEHEKFETNPLDGFASPGALFAMVASAFTKAPMQNAIEGMAGALNGIKSRNEADYNRAYDSWKENMKLAEQRHKMQHEAYTDALALADHDVAASNAKLRENAVRFGDQQTLFLLEHGMNKELYELLDARNKSMTQAVAASQAIQEHGLQTTLFKQRMAALPPLDKSATPQQKAQYAAQKLAIMQQTHMLASDDPKMAMMGHWLFEHPDAKPEEQQEAARGFGVIPQKAVSPIAAEESLAIEDEMRRHPDITRTDAIAKVHGAMSQRNLNTLSAIDAGEVKRRAKQYTDGGMEEGEAFEKARAEVQAARTGGKLPDDTLKAIGAEKASGDNSGMVGLSPYNRMKANQYAVEAVQQKAQEKRADIKKQHPDWDDETIDRAAKLTPEQLGDTLAKQGASYQGLKSALRAVDVRSQAIRTAAVEAKKFMTIAQAASDEVPRTSSIAFNKLVQMGEAQVSDPKLKRFATANNTLVQQYARAIAPTGVPTDQVRSHAYALLSTADGPAAYKAVLNIMNQEMDAAIESPDSVRAMLMGETGDPTHAKNVESFGGNNIIKYDAQGNRVQ